ncbi:F0F1 ATP synthase subunit alpha [Aquicoccus sp. SCR17]|nr:F0F1 ATP synthase subunit alpha [Carideicomes alvinocaridis]
MTEAPHEAAMDALKARIAGAELGASAQERGAVIGLADGLATVSGLPGVFLDEELIFSTGARGFVLALEETTVQVALIDPSDGISAGQPVARTGQAVSVPVGEALLGRVVDPLGRPLDDRELPETTARLPAERLAPGIIERDFVNQPLETGLLVVDALFAIGRGQRELIVGERQTGKTSIAVDAILNQRESDVICIYVAIGQHASAVARVIDTVRSRGAMERTIFVVAEAAGEPGLRWLAPFSATSMAEAYCETGRDVLIVYDDLTKHAATHRELALLARQPPGREAYPGDIFYLHARLLERSGKRSAKRCGGSITALPIAEIDAGNLSAYIPTNLISISDGQIVTSAALFAANQRPAIDVGLSVSRVGGKAQAGAMKAVAGRVRLDYAQYLEMKIFSRFGGFGDSASAARLVRGEWIAALLAQHRFAPLPLVAQVALLAALDAGVLDKIDPGRIAALKGVLPKRLGGDPRFDGLRALPDALDDDTRAALLEAVRAALEAE